jgi:hypothetical protein
MNRTAHYIILGYLTYVMLIFENVVWWFISDLTLGVEMLQIILAGVVVGAGFIVARVIRKAAKRDAVAVAKMNRK